MVSTSSSSSFSLLLLLFALVLLLSSSSTTSSSRPSAFVVSPYHTRHHIHRSPLPTITLLAAAASSSPSSDPCAPDTVSAPHVALHLPPNYRRVDISYCVGCRWMLRAAWLAQELLTTFQDELDEVAIRPIREPAGTFDVHVNNQLVFSREIEKRFPEAKEVKQLVRDIINPERDLGHSDVKKD